MLIIQHTPTGKGVGALIEGKMSFDFVELHISKNTKYPYRFKREYSTMNIVDLQRRGVPTIIPLPVYLFKGDKYLFMGAKEPQDRVIKALKDMISTVPNEVKDQIADNENCVIRIQYNKRNNVKYKIIPKKPYPFVLFNDKKADKELYDSLLGEFDHEITYQPHFNLLFVDIKPKLKTLLNDKVTPMGIDASPVQIMIDLTTLEGTLAHNNDTLSIATFQFYDTKLKRKTTRKPANFSIADILDESVTVFLPYTLNYPNAPLYVQAGGNANYRYHHRKTTRLPQHNRHLLLSSIDVTYMFTPFQFSVYDRRWKRLIQQAMSGHSYYLHDGLEFSYRGLTNPCYGTFQSVLLDALLDTSEDAPLDFRLLMYLKTLMDYMELVDLKDSAGIGMMPFMNTDLILRALNGEFK
jgi:hypothetical protein